MSLTVRVHNQLVFWPPEGQLANILVVGWSCKGVVWSTPLQHGAECNSLFRYSPTTVLFSAILIIQHYQDHEHYTFVIENFFINDIGESRMNDKET